MSKGAFHRVAGLLATELDGTGVRCFNVQPNLIATERIAADMAEFGIENVGAPADVVGVVVDWLVTDPEAEALNGQNIEAQFFCHERGLLPGWAGPNPNEAPIRYDMSGKVLDDLERDLRERAARAAPSTADGSLPQRQGTIGSSAAAGMSRTVARLRLGGVRQRGTAPTSQETIMTLVTAQMSVSLDGFYAGPQFDGTGNWMESPEALGFFRVTRWVLGAMAWRERLGFDGGERDVDSDIVEETFAAAGAYVMGRRMADGGEIPWGDEPPFHAPVFVVTSRPRETLERKGGTSFTYVTDGSRARSSRPKAAASGKNVAVAGGGSLLRQVIGAGLLDELELHIVPGPARRRAATVRSGRARSRRPRHDRAHADAHRAEPGRHAHPLSRQWSNRVDHRRADHSPRELTRSVQHRLSTMARAAVG